LRRVDVRRCHSPRRRCRSRGTEEEREGDALSEPRPASPSTRRARSRQGVSPGPASVIASTRRTTRRGYGTSSRVRSCPPGGGAWNDPGPFHISWTSRSSGSSSSSTALGLRRRVLPWSMGRALLPGSPCTCSEVLVVPTSALGGLSPTSWSATPGRLSPCSTPSTSRLAGHRTAQTVSSAATATSSSRTSAGSVMGRRRSAPPRHARGVRRAPRAAFPHGSNRIARTCTPCVTLMFSAPRVGPSATFGKDWLPGVHERQLQHLARRRERDGTPG
jgi:hypothetical protein